VTDFLARVPGQIPAGWATAYDETSFWAARFGALLFDNLELRPVRNGLDVACGTGFPLIELANVHGPSSEWIGIDVWADALDRARKKIELHRLPNVTVRETDAAAMPFDDESFDLITTNLGVNNFSDPQKVMNECARVARHGARMVITTNITGHMATMYDLLRSVAPDRVNAINQQEQHRGTLESLSALLTNAGFAISRHVRSEFALRFADGKAMLRHSLVQWFIDDWRGAIGSDAKLWSDIERRLDERAPLEFPIPMLYLEAVKE
jgi:arsenite methyltransferase